jgi:4-hydroxy-2-oxoheptanedioate aldolase
MYAKSKLLAKMRAGDFVKVVNINRVTDPWLAEVAGQLGFDVVWLDLEHRPHGYEAIQNVSVACRYSGVDLMVRIRETGYTSVMGALELGANGILIPHCSDPQVARQLAEWTRFPPQGKRGFDSAAVDANYALSDCREFLRERNLETFLVLEIEDQTAVERVDEIVSVEGVDGLFVGPADLTISYGVPFDRNNPIIQRAMDKIAIATAKAGKWWGTVTETPESAQRELDRGARMVTCADDHFLLVKGMQDAYRQFEGISIR